ncbi:MAG: OmpA family protein [Bacteroidales bacterium]|nr:OmpA family protein [Bacteroidales bacterium]
MKKIIIWLMMILLCQIVYAQNSDRSLLTARNFYENGNYTQALSSIQRVDAVNQNNAEYSLLRAKINLGLHNYNNAYNWLLKFKNEYNGQDVLIDEHILSTIKQAIEYVKYSKVKASVNRIPGRVSSIHSEYAPIITNNGNTMIFGSDRRSPFGKENIFISYFINDSWVAPIEIRELCTDLNETVGSISNDQNTVFLSGQYDGKRVSNIFKAELSNNKWTNPEIINTLSSRFNDIQPFVYNEEVMFFASNRDGDNSTYDIFVSEFRNGQWGTPQKLDSNINTNGHEITPFLAPDGETLYFASDTHKGFGGFDIFRAKKDGNSWTQWTTPENLGPIVNSVKDDRYFFVCEDNINAYFSSNRFDGLGLEDIYHFDMRSFDLEPAIEEIIVKGFVVDNNDERVSTNIRWSYIVKNLPNEIVVQSNANGEFSFKIENTDKLNYFVADKRYNPLEKELIIPERTPELNVVITLERYLNILEISGNVMDSKSTPIETDIMWTYEFNNEIANIIVTTNEQGEYQISLPVISNIQYNIDKEGYLAIDNSMQIPANELKINMNFILTELVAGEEYDIADIEFEFDSAKLKPSSFESLDQLVKTMQNNPKVNFSIIGHTDNVGAKEYNDNLSYQRAMSVANYLIENGINRNRLNIEGKGFSEPKVPNDSEENRAINRRVVMIPQE